MVSWTHWAGRSAGGAWPIAACPPQPRAAHPGPPEPARNGDGRPQAGPPFRPSAKGRNVSNLRLSLSPAHFFPAFSSAIACFSFFTFGAITYEQ